MMADDPLPKQIIWAGKTEDTTCWNCGEFVSANQPHGCYRDEIEWAKANERQEYEELMSDYDALFKVADAANWARSLVSFDDAIERQLGPLRKALEALPKDIQEEIEENEKKRTIARLSLASKGSASRKLLREDEVMEAWVAKAILRFEEYEALR